MTTPHPAYPSTPSLRGVRDKYLHLLLTAGTNTPATPPPPTPNPTSHPPWTPGHQFHTATAPSPQLHHPWTSPVTPPPTENEVRLAELAAGLVAAGDAQQRNSNTIRRLADQLHKSERKIKRLQATDRVHRAPASDHPAEYSPPRYSDPDHRSTRRHIRFTPRVSAGEDGESGSAAVERAKRHGVERGGRASFDRRMLSELSALKKEQAAWKREREKSRAEAAKLAAMLVDIRRNTQRLLAEREQHLRVIATLQEEVDSQRRVTGGLFSACTGQSEGVPSPVPLFGDRQSSGRDGGFRREGSPNSVRGGDFGGEDHCVVAGFGDGDGIMAERNGDEVREREDREQELREELKLVLDENQRLAERIPTLESECFDLSRRLRHAEQQLEATGENQRELEQWQRSQSAHERRIAETTATVKGDAGGELVAHELDKLLEEMDIFEGVCVAVNFGTGPYEADQLQDSISTLQMSYSVSENKQDVTVRGPSSNDEIVRQVVRRLIGIRATLSERYGEWLKCVANDDESSSMHMTEPSQHSSLEAALDVTMDTEVIDDIIRDR